MLVIETITELRLVLDAMRRKANKIGLVPTMGGLHRGHMELVKQAKRRGSVVVSIFVNPTQFGQNEDLDTYPRDLPSDIALCEKHGVDIVFAPSVTEIYPAPMGTIVDVEPLSNILIGVLRPGHFKGVATVVTKLFNIVEPDVAFFGEKDFQQLAVIRRMVNDLSSRVDVVGVPTVRDDDGLACSTRNVKLTTDDRSSAIVVPNALRLAELMISNGERDTSIIRNAIETMIQNVPNAVVQSVDICDVKTLQAVTKIGHDPVVALIAVKFGEVSLIDQIVVEANDGTLQ
ncbi:pantoate--beta-alanine ligase (plasmid) [Agrobacterium sp. rho-13.3]|uniref:pantoate--beta-alanine ligase n=1 Tax=Agrobacterium sp. rho-13.3 TaxID=3072980 RepID=UPI002A11C792|nr:pantoate--beta-alanine ligase [Agrobacterium sp. rho-13.3]MDX8310274.1 pantoate--beta-alanine ligase [Agrobacterium sp. rho-13.3]